MIPYGRQSIDDEDVRAVAEVLRSDWLTTGPAVERFEAAVAEFTGARHAVAVSSGTAALHAAVHALGIGPGDEVIVPPMTSQYLNLTKNSSLAVAIGYQDIVSIADTTLNQTGQAIEGIALIMAVYLTISLSISLCMNWYNARIALTER